MNRISKKPITISQFFKVNCWLVMSVCLAISAVGTASAKDETAEQVKDTVNEQIDTLKAEKKKLEQCRGRFPQFRDTEPTGIGIRTFEVSGDIKPALCQDVAGSCALEPEDYIPATYTALVKGNVGDPVVMMLHGFPGSADDYRYLMDDMAAAGYYVVAPYLRGYYPTKSALVEDPTIMLDLVATDLIGIAETLIGETESTNNFIIGHDWGSLLGQEVMEQTGSSFEKYVSIFNIPLSDAGGTISYLSLFSQFKFHQNLFYVYAHQIAPSTGNFNFDLVVDLGLTIEPVDWIGELWKSWDPYTANSVDIENAKRALLSDTVNDTPNVDLKNALNYYRNFFAGSGLSANFHQPALAIYGDLDKAASGFSTDQETIDLIYSLVNDPSFPGAKLGAPWEVVTLECAGHWPHIGQPDNVRDAIFDFLEIDDWQLNGKKET